MAHRRFYIKAVSILLLLLVASCSKEKKSPSTTGNVTPQSIYLENQQRYNQQQYQPKYQLVQPYGYYQEPRAQRYQQRYQQAPYVEHYNFHEAQPVYDEDYYYHAPTRYNNIEDAEPAKPFQNHFNMPTDW